MLILLSDVRRPAFRAGGYGRVHKRSEFRYFPSLGRTKDRASLSLHDVEAGGTSQ